MIEIELKERLGRRLEEISKKIERIGDDSTLSQPSSNKLEFGQNELSTLTRSIEESNTQLTSKFVALILMALHVEYLNFTG
jgi:hypothetical protein